MPESEEDYIEFDKVYGDRKEALRNQVIDIFRSRFSFVNLKLYFKSIFGYNENICLVSKFTFDVITYLKVHAPKAAFIFLLNNENEEVDKIVKCMKKNRKEDLSLYDTYTIASALGKYISDELNGLFLQSVILNLKNNFSSSNFEKEVEFLPFTMKDDRRKLFRELIKLFKAIHKNRNDSFMSLNDLFLVFLPNLLPKQAVNKKSKKFLKFIKRLRVLLKVNFEFVKINFKEEGEDDFYYECSLL